jgi:hypothetical protein
MLLTSKLTFDKFLCQFHQWLILIIYFSKIYLNVTLSFPSLSTPSGHSPWSITQKFCIYLSLPNVGTCQTYCSLPYSTILTTLTCSLLYFVILTILTCITSITHNIPHYNLLHQNNSLTLLFQNTCNGCSSFHVSHP